MDSACAPVIVQNNLGMLQNHAQKPGSFLAAWAAGLYDDSPVDADDAERAQIMPEGAIKKTHRAARLEAGIMSTPRASPLHSPHFLSPLRVGRAPSAALIQGLSPGGPGGAADSPNAAAAAARHATARPAAGVDALTAHVVQLEETTRSPRPSPARLPASMHQRPPQPAAHGFRNGGGPLSRAIKPFSSEQLAAVEAAAAKAREAQKEVQRRNEFGTVDTDGSGGLSAAELAKKLKLSGEEAAAIVALYDQNGDGELQFDEFAEAQRQLGPVVDLGDPRRSGARAAELARVSAALARSSKTEANERVDAQIRADREEEARKAAKERGESVGEAEGGHVESTHAGGEEDEATAAVRRAREAVEAADQAEQAALRVLSATANPAPSEGEPEADADAGANATPLMEAGDQAKAGVAEEATDESEPHEASQAPDGDSEARPRSRPLSSVSATDADRGIQQP